MSLGPPFPEIRGSGNSTAFGLGCPAARPAGSGLHPPSTRALPLAVDLEESARQQQVALLAFREAFAQGDGDGLRQVVEDCVRAGSLASGDAQQLVSGVAEIVKPQASESRAGSAGDENANARLALAKKKASDLRANEQRKRLLRKLELDQQARQEAERREEEDRVKRQGEDARRRAQLAVERVAASHSLALLRPPAGWMPKARPPQKMKNPPRPKEPPRIWGSFAAARAICRMQKSAEEARRKVFVIERGTQLTRFGWSHEGKLLGTVETQDKTAWDLLDAFAAVQERSVQDLVRNRPVLVTEDEAALDVSSFGHDRMHQELVRKRKALGWYVANRAMVSLLSSGRNTGLVVDMSQKCLRIVPVYEGSVVEGAVQACEDFGSGQVEDNYVCFIDRMAMEKNALELCREVKEEQGRIALHYNCEVGMNNLLGSTDIAMQTCELRWELITVPEMLFEPRLKWQIQKKASVVDMVVRALEACDQDIRYLLVRNIVLTSNGTRLEGFKDRLAMELAQVLPPIFDIVIEDLTSEDSSSPASWRGALAMATSSRFHHLLHRAASGLQEGIPSG